MIDVLSKVATVVGCDNKANRVRLDLRQVGPASSEKLFL